MRIGYVVKALSIIYKYIGSEDTNTTTVGITNIKKKLTKKYSFPVLFLINLFASVPNLTYTSEMKSFNKP